MLWATANLTGFPLHSSSCQNGRMLSLNFLTSCYLKPVIIERRHRDAKRSTVASRRYDVSPERFVFCQLQSVGHRNSRVYHHPELCNRSDGSGLLVHHYRGGDDKGDRGTRPPDILLGDANASLPQQLLLLVKKTFSLMTRADKLSKRSLHSCMFKC